MTEELKEKYDALLITSDSNRFYQTGMHSSFGCVVLFVKDGKKYFFTDFRYGIAARQKAEGCEVVIVTSDDLWSKVSDVLSSRDARVVGFEDRMMSVAAHKALKKELKSFELKAIGDELDRLRMCKTEKELAAIKKAQSVTEEALAAVLPLLKAGVTEKDVSAELTYRFLKAGADGLAFDNIVSFGDASADCHHEPTDRKLENTDIILFDIGAKWDGYCSDMTRTFCFGDPSKRMRDVYDLVLSAQNYVLKHLRAGMTGREADSLAREFFKANGYDKEFGHSLGHGVGIDIHESPRLSQTNDEPLPENAVVTVEPGLYIDGFGGVRIEDMVVLKKDGIENLTNFPKNFII